MGSFAKNCKHQLGKFPFVEVGISHTITPSRTRLPHLAHDYPYLAHDYSHLVHDFRVGRDGCFAVSGRKRQDEHE